ncbi:MAG TPA: hypothetical protein H9960_03010 [Candidatus Duodenibacillus intestinigallinarum]|nr:hypothetical protein [Candidatus Duodenibacillus intestinigallinarum]
MKKRRLNKGRKEKFRHFDRKNLAQAEISVENATNRSETQEEEMAVASPKMVAILIFVQVLV